MPDETTVNDRGVDEKLSNQTGIITTTVSKEVKGEKPEVLTDAKHVIAGLQGDPATFARVTVGKSLTINMGPYESARISVEISAPTDQKIGVDKMLNWATAKVDRYVGEEVHKVRTTWKTK